jgi:hypothetical protein
MRVWTKHQLKKFNVACHEQKKKARIMCDKLGCFAVYYGYADYENGVLRNNLVSQYELFLRPLDKTQCDQLEAETRIEYPDRALFVVFER